MAEFFQAFAPLYDGFRQRAGEVQALLRRPDTGFLLVSGPGESRVPDTLYFARRLQQGKHHLAGIVVNQVHGGGPGEWGQEGQRGSSRATPAPSAPSAPSAPAVPIGAELLRWLRERDARGLAALRQLVTDGTPLAHLPLLAEPPTGLEELTALGRALTQRLAAVAAVRYDTAAMRRGRRRGRPAPGGRAEWSD
jgi:hypothetical protein